MVPVRLSDVPSMPDERTASSGHVPNASSKLLKILDIPHLLKDITAELSILDCINLTSSCSFLKTKRVEIWNINIHLHHFLQDPRAFRSLMMRHRALGEAALVQLSAHLLVKEKYTFVPFNQQAKNHIDAIRGREAAYKARKEDIMRRIGSTITADLIFYEMKSIEGVFHFERGSGEKRRQVQIIATVGPPLYAILNDFYATHIFNFYDHQTVYSLFPQQTFLQRTGYITKPVTPRIRDCCEKYRKRDWEIISYPHTFAYTYDPPEDPDTRIVWFELENHHGVRSSRRIGDKHTWMMDLRASHAGTPHSVSNDLEYCTFGIDFEEPDIRVHCRPYVNASFQQPLVINSSITTWKRSVKSLFDGMNKVYETKRDEDDPRKYLPTLWGMYEALEGQSAATEGKLKKRVENLKEKLERKQIRSNLLERKLEEVRLWTEPVTEEEVEEQQRLWSSV
ncbi:hypothetical protein ABW21_db0203507 [Orbilia brochopaga]|nr:hypothetical protein ABW21_db0203507 [Drechslerella brochopaga]